MKIVAPLNRFNEIESLIMAGADELYCGFIDKSGWQEYAGSACLNRRGEVFSNLNSMKELKEAARTAHQRSVPLILALNEFYSEAQSLAAVRQAEEAVDCGIDALLVADIGLIFMLRDRLKKVELHLSSCATVFNSKAIELYADLGITRVILHRHFNIEEMKILKGRIPGHLNVEAFILNERCYNLDGYCSFQHGSAPGIFNLNRHPFLNSVTKKYVRFLPQGMLQPVNRRMVRNSHPCCFSFGGYIFNTAENFLYACGICDMYDFYKLGISHLKIAGRSILTDQVNNVSIVREALGLLDDKISREDFILKAKDIVKSKHRKCAPDRCYYFSEQ